MITPALLPSLGWLDYLRLGDDTRAWSASTVNWVASISAESWTALAAWAAVAIALAAATVGRGQLTEARALRREQAQPYVVAFLEPSLADAVHVDLVIRNTGATAAFNVCVRIDPLPRRTARTGDDAPLPVVIPEFFPVLVPGQEWRAFWDSTHVRPAGDLPSRHDAIVTFDDSREESHSLQYVLDFEPLIQRGYLVVYGEHHAAKALRDISNEVKKWSGSTPRIGVWVRDGDARAARQRKAQKVERRIDAGGLRAGLHRLASQVRARFGQ